MPNQCFAAAFDAGAERLAATVATAVESERGWAPRLAAGLAAGLDFLAAEPALARLLLVESLSAARLEYEHTLSRLARALRRPSSDLGHRPGAEEEARLRAGGLVSRLSGIVLAGEAARLPESREPLLQYLLATTPPPLAQRNGERYAAHG